MKSNVFARRERKLITKRDVSNRCVISLRTVDNWMEQGILPYLKIGKVIRFDSDEVDLAIARFKVNVS
jgi:predicted DNA-binding transcriptional regulator AlpA